MLRLATVLCVVGLVLPAGCASGKLTSAKKRELLTLEYRAADRAEFEYCGNRRASSACVGIPRAAVQMIESLEQGHRAQTTALLLFARLGQKSLVPVLHLHLRAKPDHKPATFAAALLYLEGAEHAGLARDVAAGGSMTVALIDAAASVSPRLASAVAQAGLNSRAGPAWLTEGLNGANAPHLRRAFRALGESGDSAVLPRLQRWADAVRTPGKSSHRPAGADGLWWDLAAARAQLHDDAFTATVRDEVRRFGVNVADAWRVAPVFGHHPDDAEVLLGLIKGKHRDADESWSLRLVDWATNARARRSADSSWATAATATLQSLRELQRRLPEDHASIHLDAAAALLGDRDALARLRQRAASTPKKREAWLATEYLIVLDPSAARDATIRLASARLSRTGRPRTNLTRAWANAGEDPGLAWFAMALQHPGASELVAMARAYPPDCAGWRDIDAHLRTERAAQLRDEPRARSVLPTVFKRTSALSVLDDDWCAEELMALAIDDSAVFYARTAALHLMAVQRRPEFDAAFEHMFGDAAPEDPNRRLFANMRDLWE